MGNQWKVIGERQHAKRLKFRESDQSIIREYENRRSITYPFDRGPETLERVRKFFKRRRKRDEYLTFAIGGKSKFNITIHSLADFNRYVNKIEAEWRRREKLTDIESPFPYLQIVEVKREEDSDDEESDL